MILIEGKHAIVQYCSAKNPIYIKTPSLKTNLSKIGVVELPGINVAQYLESASFVKFILNQKERLYKI